MMDATILLCQATGGGPSLRDNLLAPFSPFRPGRGPDRARLSQFARSATALGALKVSHVDSRVSMNATSERTKAPVWVSDGSGLRAFTTYCGEQ